MAGVVSRGLEALVVEYINVWYSQFVKTSLRKHNLRVDFRVYIGDESEPYNTNELESKIKSLLSSAIIKGLDVVGVVSRFGIEPGMMAKRQAETNNVDIKVIPGQDYFSSDKFYAVFYNIQQTLPHGLGIQEAIIKCKQQNGKVLMYNLHKRQAQEIDGWQSTKFEPDLVEILNAKTQVYHDMDIDYPRVISSAAISGTELENTPLYTEISRKQMENFGFLSENEGADFMPGYLSNGGLNG